MHIFFGQIIQWIFFIGLNKKVNRSVFLLEALGENTHLFFCRLPEATCILRLWVSSSVFTAYLSNHFFYDHTSLSLTLLPIDYKNQYPYATSSQWPRDSFGFHNHDLIASSMIFFIKLSIWGFFLIAAWTYLEKNFIILLFLEGWGRDTRFSDYFCNHREMYIYNLNEKYVLL